MVEKKTGYDTSCGVDRGVRCRLAVMEYSFLLYLLVCVAGTSCVIWGPEDRPSSPSVVEFDQEAIPGADEELRRLGRDYW